MGFARLTFQKQRLRQRQENEDINYSLKPDTSVPRSPSTGTQGKLTLDLLDNPRPPGEEPWPGNRVHPYTHRPCWMLVTTAGGSREAGQSLEESGAWTISYQLIAALPKLYRLLLMTGTPHLLNKR